MMEEEGGEKRGQMSTTGRGDKSREEHWYGNERRAKRREGSAVEDGITERRDNGSQQCKGFRNIRIGSAGGLSASLPSKISFPGEKP